MTTIGMYGGKFCPMHKGHLSVMQLAMDMCDVLYVFLFVNGDDERYIVWEWYTDPQFRMFQLMKARRECLNKMRMGDSKVCDIRMIDVNDYRSTGEDGIPYEDWDKEAELIKEIIGAPLNYVYSSEQRYDAFFKKAYPEAEHIIVDEKRETFNISATKVREMLSENRIEEAMEWMV